MVTELMDGAEHEQVLFCRDRDTALRAIIAVHSTVLGPALGGTRFFPFASEEEALADVLKLSRAMTYKSAAAGLDLGGGKAVIIGDPRRDKTEPLLQAYARYVDSLRGRYITTEDVGTTEADMIVIRRQTRFVTGMPTEWGGSGDPSEATAWGVLHAMRTVAERLWGSDSLAERHVAIQGVGKVGTYLAGYLAKDGCRLTIADVSPDATERVAGEMDVTIVAAGEVHTTPCDIFAPCALGGALNPRTIPQLACAAVIGCANNQLESPESAGLLAEHGILYGPDYIVNAGGVINISFEIGRHYDKEAAFARVTEIGATLKRVIERAENEGITTAAAADRIAEERIQSQGAAGAAS
jgi:glutamate dehydrogenase/leucine dehydrogenase